MMRGNSGEVKLLWVCETKLKRAALISAVCEDEAPRGELELTFKTSPLQHTLQINRDGSAGPKT